VDDHAVGDARGGDLLAVEEGAVGAVEVGDFHSPAAVSTRTWVREMR
jgi:hypothetical protein